MIGVLQRALDDKPTDDIVGPCADVEPDVMFPDEHLPNNHPDVIAAKKVCLGCDSRFECLQGAVERREEYGVWGAMTPKERHAMNRRRTRAAQGQTEMLAVAL